MLCEQRACSTCALITPSCTAMQDLHVWRHTGQCYCLVHMALAHMKGMQYLWPHRAHTSRAPGRATLSRHHHTGTGAFRKTPSTLPGSRCTMSCLMTRRPARACPPGGRVRQWQIHDLMASQKVLCSMCVACMIEDDRVQAHRAGRRVSQHTAILCLRQCKRHEGSRSVIKSHLPTSVCPGLASGTLSAPCWRGLVRRWLGEVFFPALLAGGCSGAAAFWADLCFFLLFSSFTLSIACTARACWSSHVLMRLNTYNAMLGTLAHLQRRA